MVLGEAVLGGAVLGGAERCWVVLGEAVLGGRCWTHRVEVGYSLDLLVVVGAGQLGQALGVELPAVREELGPVLLGQLCAERVDGDDEGPTVRLELEAERTREDLYTYSHTHTH